jgi:hypothetical protein
MEVSKEQLVRYADVICADQAGNSTFDIATAFQLPQSLVVVWIDNFRQLDGGYRG